MIVAKKPSEMADVRNNIFIICQHRTGSTLLKNMLDQHPMISMAFDEMNLFDRFRKNTLNRLIEDRNPDIAQILTLIKTGAIHGTFWQKFENSGITIEELRQKLSSHERPTVWQLIESILQLLREKNHAQLSGIKYPVHIKALDLLLENFRSSIVIFLTRNPAAIIASKLNDPATKARKQTSIIHKVGIHYFTILLFSFDYVKSVKAYTRNKDRMRLVTYESLIKKRKEELIGLCDYFGIEFKEEMLQAAGKESSHDINSDKTLYTNSLDKYKGVLNKFDLALIRFLTNTHYKKILSYESGANI